MIPHLPEMVKAVSRRGFTVDAEYNSLVETHQLPVFFQVHRIRGSPSHRRQTDPFILDEPGG
jgi:hypothetical protein